MFTFSAPKQNGEFGFRLGRDWPERPDGLRRKTRSPCRTCTPPTGAFTLHADTARTTTPTSAAASSKQPARPASSCGRSVTLANRTRPAGLQAAAANTASIRLSKTENPPKSVISRFWASGHHYDDALRHARADVVEAPVKIAPQQRSGSVCVVRDRITFPAYNCSVPTVSGQPQPVGVSWPRPH